MGKKAYYLGKAKTDLCDLCREHKACYYGPTLQGPLVEMCTTCYKAIGKQGQATVIPIKIKDPSRYS